MIIIFINIIILIIVISIQMQGILLYITRHLYQFDKEFHFFLLLLLKYVCIPMCLYFCMSVCVY